MARFGASVSSYPVSGMAALVAASALPTPISAKDYTSAFPNGSEIPANLGNYVDAWILDANPMSPGG